MRDVAEESKLDDLHEEVDELKGRMTWQPIGTAPKDGTQVLVSGPATGKLSATGNSAVSVARWDGFEWKATVSGWEVWDDSQMGQAQPTHWMPLPPPPDVSGTNVAVKQQTT